MKCKVCRDNIQPHEFDSHNAFTEISPISFRRATFHSYCYQLEAEEAEQTPSSSNQYLNRWDEYLSRGLQIITI